MARRNPSGGYSSQVRLAVAVIVAGFFVFLIGLFPGLIRLDLTPGIGLVQITTFLVGISLMALGAYGYVSGTRQAIGPHQLGQAIGARLMGTGLVICYAASYADILGIGTERPGEALILGPLQAAGIVLGVLIIVAGLLIYIWR